MPAIQEFLMIFPTGAIRLRLANAVKAYSTPQSLVKCVEPVVEVDRSLPERIASLTEFIPLPVVRTIAADLVAVAPELEARMRTFGLI